MYGCGRQPRGGRCYGTGPGGQWKRVCFILLHLHLAKPRGFGITVSARASLNVALVIVGLSGQSGSMSYRDRTGRPTSFSMPLDARTKWTSSW
eukprot:6203811-Pleurochrysis_carterae.AAC.1